MKRKNIIETLLILVTVMIVCSLAIPALAESGVRSVSVQNTLRAGRGRTGSNDSGEETTAQPNRDDPQLPVTEGDDENDYPECRADCTSGNASRTGCWGRSFCSQGAEGSSRCQNCPYAYDGDGSCTDDSNCLNSGANCSVISSQTYSGREFRRSDSRSGSSRGCGCRTGR